MSIFASYLSILRTLVFRIGLVYIFYSITRVAFYYINQSKFGIIPIGDWFSILAGGLVFDTSAIAYTNAIFIVLWLLPIRSLTGDKRYQKLVLSLFILVNSICLLLNIVDFFYYEFNLKRMTADFSHWASEGNSGKIIFSFISTHWIGTLIAGLFLVSFNWLNKKLQIADYRGVSHLHFYTGQIVFLFIFIGLLIGGMRGGFRYSTRPITLSNAGQYVTKSEHMPIVLNTPFSIIRTFDKKVFEEKHYMSEINAQDIYNPITDFKYAADSLVKKNIVIIILESFSREHSKYLNPDLYPDSVESYTPFLDSLMSVGKICTHAFANGRKSIDAMPSILAGIPSLEVPYVLSHNSLNKINSIATLLKPYGYHCSFFHGAPNGSMGFQAFAQIADFDHYYGKTEFNDDRYYDGIWGIWDEEFFSFFANTISEGTQPFLGVVFSLSSHHPYKVPEKYNGAFRTGQLEVHQAIQYTDHSLRQFFEIARKQNWYSNTLFVITADHSTVAWSDKYNSQAGAFSIPILYFDPGNESLAGQYNHVSQQTDILPSILDYLHFPEPFIAFGKSIFDTSASRIAFNYLNEHYQIIDDNNLLSLSNGNQLTDLYDISKSWILSDNKVGQDSMQDTKLLKLHQALIQQYNHRIIHNKLIISKNGN